MTTTVKIEAHCGSDTEVSVFLEDEDENMATGKVVAVLQDGETHELYVYDNRQVSIMERKKQPDATAQLGGGNGPPDDND